MNLEKSEFNRDEFPKELSWGAQLIYFNLMLASIWWAAVPKPPLWTLFKYI